MIRLWLLRLRLRLGGISVFVCRHCRDVSYHPWFMRDVRCPWCTFPDPYRPGELEHVACMRVEWRAWGLPRGWLT